MICWLNYIGNVKKFSTINRKLCNWSYIIAFFMIFSFQNLIFDVNKIYNAYKYICRINFSKLKFKKEKI